MVGACILARTNRLTVLSYVKLVNGSPAVKRLPLPRYYRDFGLRYRDIPEVPVTVSLCCKDYMTFCIINHCCIMIISAKRVYYDRFSR